MRTSILALILVLGVQPPTSAQTVADMIGPDYIIMPDSERVDVVIHEIKNTERSPKRWEKAIYYSRIETPSEVDTIFTKDVLDYQEFELWKAPWPTGDDGRIRFEEVVQVPGADANELYLRARTWFVDYFKQSDEVIEFEDKESGKIMGKGAHKFVITKKTDLGGTFSYDRRLMYTITVMFRDGRYRYEIDNLMIWSAAIYGQYVAIPESTLPVIERGVEAFYDKKGREDELAVQAKTKSIMAIHSAVESLKNAMAIEASGSEDDW